MGIAPSVELVQYVTDDGQLTGETEEKLPAHHANTRKHLAFSCYIFNDKGEFLVTQRAAVKKVWPTVWTNSCCGHPMPGESMEQAIGRRADAELGIKGFREIKLIVPDYSYVTPLYNGVIDNEFCPIHVALLDGGVTRNPQEVDDYQWMTWEDYKAWLTREPDLFSYWCKDQLSLVDAHIQAYVAALQAK